MFKQLLPIIIFFILLYGNELLSRFKRTSKLSQTLFSKTAKIRDRSDPICRAARIAAQKGNPEHQYNLAYMYEMGNDVLRDYGQAVGWYKKAAIQGYVPAQLALAALYAAGSGAPCDLEKAFGWLKKAADSKDSEALLCLGKAYEQGVGTAVDYAKAMECYLAARDDAGALCNIGRLHELGYGTAADKAIAYDWYYKAAQLGNVAAMGRIAQMYYYGDGQERDFEKAQHWLKQSTDCAESASILGQMYLVGEGLPQDCDQALFFLEAAAKKGDGALGDVYRDGREFPQNYAKAYLWYHVALWNNKDNIKQSVSMIWKRKCP